MINFNIIVAIDSKNGIGKDGNLPWHLSQELKYFKAITTKTVSPDKKNVVIMGRKTWESIPEKFRPLLDRINVVLTHNKELDLPEGVLKACSFEDVVNVLEADMLQNSWGEVFVIGGRGIFDEAFKYYPQCQKLYVTEIQGDFNCDVFLPFFKEKFEKKVVSSAQVENGVTYFFTEYVLKEAAK